MVMYMIYVYYVCIFFMLPMFAIQIEDEVQDLWWRTRPRLLKMKETKNFGDMQAFLNDLSNRQKTILIDLHTLLKLNRDWRSTSLYARVNNAYVITNISC